MEIRYSKQAEKFWNIISEHFTPSWDSIEEEELDEFDLQMLKAIESDSERHEFTSKENINWDE